MRKKAFQIITALLFVFVFALAMAGCSSDDKKQDRLVKSSKDMSFMSIGGFSVNPIAKGWVEVRDGAGRTFVLIPRGETAPEGYQPEQIVYTPVKRVAAYGSFDVSILKALGVLEDVLVGVTDKRENWTIPEVAEGMDQGKIVFLGNYNSIDFERLKQSEPEIVLTWDMSIIPMVEEMGAACIITTTPVAMCLNARMHFVNFIAPFFNREKEAKEYFTRVSDSLDAIRATTRNAKNQPKVMWGTSMKKECWSNPAMPGSVNLWVLLRATMFLRMSLECPALKFPLSAFYSAARMPRSSLPTEPPKAEQHPRQRLPGPTP